MDFKELEEFLSKETIITDKVIITLIEFLGYNSNGMKVKVADLLKILRKRIKNGDSVYIEGNSNVLTIDTFDSFIAEHFSEHILCRIQED